MQKIGNSTKTTLKKVIPHGGIKEVAKRSNTSIYTVSRVIKGVSKNPVVVKSLTEYLQELTQAKQQLNKAIELELLIHQ